jgi:hypothetical protein
VQHQEIVFGHLGQSFFFDPPDGRPDASSVPTVVVRDNDHVITATTGACTIDPVDTRLYGDAHAGSKRIGVVSLDGIAPGGRYLMRKPEGDREWIEVVAIRDGKLVLRHPLIHRYAGNATIVGCRISIAVCPAWVATLVHLSERGRGCGLARYLLRWTYRYDGFELTGMSFADLVGARSEQVVTPADVEKRFPGWSGGDESSGADYISEAFRIVRLEASGDAHAIRKIRNTEVIRELVQFRANVISLESDVMHGLPLSEELAAAERQYRACYARLVVPKPTAVPARPIYTTAPVAARAVEPSPLEPPKPARFKRTEPGTPRRIPKLT